jgi:hypothetical protein
MAMEPVLTTSIVLLVGFCWKKKRLTSVDGSLPEYCRDICGVSALVELRSGAVVF